LNRSQLRSNDDSSGSLRSIRFPRPLAAERRRTLGVLLLALLPPLVFLAAEAWLFDGDWQLPLDDSYIHLVFARSLAAGAGLAFNPGELVAGTTAPLWTALLGLLSALPGSIFLWAKLAGAAAQAGTVLLVYTIARRLDLSPARAAVAAGLVAACDWLVWSSVSGMEVNLFVLLMLGGIDRHLAERATAQRGGSRTPLSFLYFGLAALARPEGLLLPILAAADRLLRPAMRTPQPASSAAPAEPEGAFRLVRPTRGTVREILAGLLLAILVVAPVAAVFHQISGSFFPTTVAAKSSGPPGLLPNLRLLSTIAGILFASQPWMTLLALGGVVESVRRLGGAKDRGVLLALWTLALPLASAMLSSGKDLAVGNFGRYFFPLLPCVVLLGSLALAPLSFSRLRTIAVGGLRVPLGALLLVLLFAPACFSLAAGLGRYLTSCANVRDSNVALAHWLAPRLPPGAVLAVNDVGAFKYYLPNRVLDLVGLMTPQLVRRRELGAAQGKGFGDVLVEFLEERRPDFVIVFPGWFPYPARHPESFHLLRSVAIRDNITMGGEMIALYDTPWTRQPLVAVAEEAAEPPATESR
jgi:hypothetical protein